MARRSRLDSPARDVDRQLLPDEHVVDEVRKVWVAFVGPALIVVIALVVTVTAMVTVSVDVLWLPLSVGVLGLGVGADRIARVWRDRLIITDSRVMRVSGVYNRTAAWMPLSRVLDITVDRPLWLRPLRAGHLTLENAAQEQGLREFRFIPDPNNRALLIHGLRTGAATPTPVPTRTTGPRRVPDHPARRSTDRGRHRLT
jgi:hypothetical protein